MIECQRSDDGRHQITRKALKQEGSELTIAVRCSRCGLEGVASIDLVMVVRWETVDGYDPGD